MPIIKSEDEIELISDTIHKTSLNGNILDESSLSGEHELICPICNDAYYSVPRILSCLHVFCENCLNKELYNEPGSPDGHGIIVCPMCKQVTKVSVQGVTSLACDYILMNLLELSAINNSSLLCTSCKANEKAVARCVDCPHFLCPNCNTAHQYMRCFEKHLVISLDEIKNSKEKIPIHKPIRCETHRQLVTYFCATCQEPVCTDCTLVEHKSPKHSYERIDTAILKERQTIEIMVTETKQKLANCQEINALLENALSELQVKYDHTKDLINETYQSYKAILENCRDNLLEDLNKLHSEQELKVMDTFQEVSKNMEQINNAYNFTTHTLENGSEAEILCLKRLISSQLSEILSNRYIKPDINISLEFVTSYENFKYNIKVAFGYLKGTETMHQDNFKEYNMHVSMMNGHNASAHSSSPVNSSPLSVPSSFDGDMNFIGMPSQSPPPLEGLTTLGELNLARLASIASGDKDPSLPITTESSVVPSFQLSMLSSDIPSNLINNIQALAKLGTSQMSDQVADIMTNGFNGIVSNFSSMVDNNVLDLVNNTSVMNGHVTPFDSMSVSAQYYGHSGINNLDMMTDLGGIEQQNFLTFPRSTPQRVTPLEIHFKFGQLGTGNTHFNSPHGFCIADEDCVVVADTNNHRIQIFNKDGEFMNQFGIAGKIDGQLWYPRKVELLPTGRFVICDRGSERSRLQLFSKMGVFIKKIRLKYVDIVAGMTVTDDGKIVVVDSVQPALYKLTESGEVSYWFNCSHCMSEPSDVAVKDDRCYICDFKGHAVVIFNESGQFLRRIGHQGLTDYPNGIDIMNNGNILVGDSHGNKFHICIFSYNGDLLCEYECPYVKVSRCCGLKVTSEGYIITVAKNNNHVLVLNSPF